ncbi:unnamed protein product [Porites evermanni]|uniref:Uncharacterized protein n=1 Tax=Porites evermanni TaxID=104178 RepID=A0ABN8LUH9_9CNID|nr:unnamed protein product [Porites evermanni]
MDPQGLQLLADDIRKVVDYYDYTINESVFFALDERCGPHTCDRFACHYNAKRPAFNSHFYQPGSSGVNAFAQDWSKADNWLCFPVCLTLKVINHLHACNAAGTLVVSLLLVSCLKLVLPICFSSVISAIDTLIGLPRVTMYNG